MSQELRSLAASIAERRGLDPNIFIKLIETESNFNPNARGAAGEIGLGQILPTTNVDPGYGVRPASDLLDPVDNLRFSADYLAAMLKEFDGDITKAVAAYNTGPGNVEKGVIPKSTQQYISKILGADVPSSSKDSAIPASKTSDSVPSTSDPSQVTTKTDPFQKELLSLFSTPNKRLPRPPALTRVRGRGKSSPLSKLQVPGLSDIYRYSAPGGVASLIKKKA